MNNISLFLAFSAGILSFFSPCVLPLIPAYITYLTGMAVEDIQNKKSKLTLLNKSIGFTLGFSIIFIILGVSFSVFGKFLLDNLAIMRKVGGIIIIILGLHISGLFKIKYLYYEKHFASLGNIKGSFSSILMGMAFATGWTPCVGPILASILIYAGNQNTVSTGILLLIAYSLGMAIPFILAALILDTFSTQIRKLYKYFPIISAVSGILIIIMGILTFTNSVNLLSRYLSNI